VEDFGELDHLEGLGDAHKAVLTVIRHHVVVRIAARHNCFHVRIDIEQTLQSHAHANNCSAPLAALVRRLSVGSSLESVDRRQP
jgi:hypothetical protein